MHYSTDLTEQRRINAAKDLKLLLPAETITFSEPLTLDRAVDIGLKNNLEIRISQVMADIKDDTALAEKLKMLPQLNADGRFSHRSDYDLKEYENLDTGEKTLGRSISEEKSKSTMSVSLVWNMLDLGLSYIRARQAVMKSEIQRMERLRQAQNLALDIASAYWKAVMAEQEVEYITRVEAEVRKYKTTAEEMVSQNRMDPIVAKSIEKKLADLAITASNMKAEVSGARIELCRLMGLSPLTEFTLARKSFRNYIEKMPTPGDLDSEKLEMLTLYNRPEFFAADIQLQVQQAEAKAALISMFPGLRFDISGSYDDNKYLINNYWSSVAMGITADLFSLPSKYMNRKIQEKTEKMVELQRLLLTAGVIAQIHMALHDFTVKARQFQLHDESYTISENLLSMNRQLYELRNLSDTMMIQHMMENMVSRLAWERSIVNLINAYNTLLVTLGLDYSRWGENLTDMDDTEFPPDIGPSQSNIACSQRPVEFPKSGSDYHEFFITGRHASEYGCQPTHGS